MRQEGHAGTDKHTAVLQFGIEAVSLCALGVRFWTPSDGPEIWVKSGEATVQSTPMTPVQTGVDYFVPLAFENPTLRIQDLAGAGAGGISACRKVILAPALTSGSGARK